ncbi:MAG TPA: histidine kinase dimerization/phospho-acceptor domain-containing protein [Labilithrix sp.]|nr:histidine kinase dimerization/phospho-acceptor domain-containing protein [Labilithrix sp.]
MTGKGLTWTAAHLRAASSPDDVRTAIAEAAGQLGEGTVPATTALSLLEEIALDSARLRTEVRAATRVREVLLASVAHDLRNPLNTFAMSTGLLRDDLEGPELDRTRALSLLTRMDRAATRMQVLIEDLLEASRIEGGTIEFMRRPEQASAIARAALAKAKPMCAEKGATLDEGAMEEDAPVELDKARTVEALAKLVAVALKTTGEGGTIRLGVERHEEEVFFTVRAAAPRSTMSAATHDENRGGLAFLIGRGLVAAQGGRLMTENTQEGPRLVAAFPARPS